MKASIILLKIASKIKGKTVIKITNYYGNIYN